jgi:hypothetical protein
MQSINLESATKTMESLHPYICPLKIIVTDFRFQLCLIIVVIIIIINCYKIFILEIQSFLTKAKLGHPIPSWEH